MLVKLKGKKELHSGSRDRYPGKSIELLPSHVGMRSIRPGAELGQE